jgi:drug/metabolite transporter (DMT)-like permease
VYRTRSGRLIGGFLLLTLIWGTTWAAIRIGLQGVPPFTGVAVRFAIAGTLLLALAPVLGVRLGRGRHEKALWLANGLLSFCLSYAIVHWSEQYIPPGLAAMLWATYPLFVAALAHILLDADRQPRDGAVAFLVERCRLLAVDARSVGALLYLALLGSAVTFTVYYWLLARVTATRLALLSYLIPIVAVTVGVVLFDEPLRPRLLAGSALILAGVVTVSRRR